MIKLSILIRTIPQRASLLKEILGLLEKQKTPEVEILVDDTYPQMMGTKCNNMVKAATGEYVAFIDDDDLVPDNYVQSLLNAMETKPDVISFEGMCVDAKTGEAQYRYIQRLHANKWRFEPDGHLEQDVTGIAAIRREVALQAPYPDVMYYEDRGFAENLKLVAKTEVHLPNILYIHRYTPIKDYQI
jgi:glycosyltransferase involved in cell wall biosynthesis